MHAKRSLNDVIASTCMTTHIHPVMTFFQTFVSLIAKNKSTPFSTIAIGLNNTFTVTYMQRARQRDFQIEHFQCSQESNLSLILCI